MSIWDIPANRPRFDVLVIAGDLITRAERGVKWLLARFPDSHVVFVLGNHERYGADYDITLQKAREAAAGSLVHVVENEAIEIDGVEFVGASLWTNFALFGEMTVPAAMRIAEERMNDYRRIRTHEYSRKLRAADTLAYHNASVDFLRRHCAQDPDRRRVIVTHHSIDPFALPVAIRDDLIAASYSSRHLGLVHELHPQYWLSGHIHQSTDRFVGTTRLISNPKGYGPFADKPVDAWQNPDFDPHFTFAF